MENDNKLQTICEQVSATTDEQKAMQYTVLYSNFLFQTLSVVFVRHGYIMI